MRMRIALISCMTLAAGAQTFREQRLARREARAAASAFPAKGRLATAQRRSLDAGGHRRSYLVQPAQGPGPHPVVLLLHGGTQNAAEVWVQTSLPVLAARDGFVLAAQDALDRHWDDGRGATLGGKGPSGADDVGFLKALIAELVAKDGSDPAAVFMVGPSNGGFMTMRFACEAGELLRAASNFMSDLPTERRGACPAKKPLPWLSLNGTEDPIVPFAGMAEGTVKNGQPQPGLLSADETFAFWAARAGCTGAARTERLPHRLPSDPTWTERRTRTGPGGITCVQVVVHGGGHIWPNDQPLPIVAKVTGQASQDLDAGELIWDFFRGTLARP